jgi:hypothetical protein
MELVMLQFENKIANMILNKMEEANLINVDRYNKIHRELNEMKF